MLELRLRADVKRIAAMREAIRRECRRANSGPEHAETVAHVAEQLLDGDGAAGRRRRGGRTEVLVVVTVQSDATMLMVRDARPDGTALGGHLQQMLHGCTSRWSTISGRDGRTTWVEIPRASVSRPVQDPAAAVPDLAGAEPATRTSRRCRPVMLRLGTPPPLAASD